MWRRGSKDKGFTLLELLISMALIATALVAVFKLQGQNLDLRAEARFVTLATQLGRDRLSQLHGASLREGTSSGDFGDDFPLFSFEEHVSQVSGLDRLYKVELRILMDVRNRGATKEQSFETFIYQN